MARPGAWAASVEHPWDWEDLVRSEESETPRGKHVVVPFRTVDLPLRISYWGFRGSRPREKQRQKEPWPAMAPDLGLRRPCFLLLSVTRFLSDLVLTLSSLLLQTSTQPASPLNFLSHGTDHSLRLTPSPQLVPASAPQPRSTSLHPTPRRRRCNSSLSPGRDSGMLGA